jgi:hypothetical protein
MEEWQKDLIDMIETVADEVEQFKAHLRLILIL